MRPYYLRTGVSLLALVVGYLLTTTPLISHHLNQAIFTLVFAIFVGGWVL
jgi:hypothetical protein